MPEQWKHIPGFSYEVSDLGRVRSRRTGRILRTYQTKGGYLYASLFENGKVYRAGVHRIVLLAFVGPSDLDTRHLDGNPANNRLDNLKYGTPTENMEDRRRHGTHRVNIGAANPASVFTDKQVKEIRNLYQEGYTHSQIAKLYACGRVTVTNIVNRKRYANVE